MRRDSDLLQNAAMTALFPTPLVVSINPQNCPLCGEANACAMAIEPDDGKVPAPCWCMAAVFNAPLFEPLPEVARGQACICARCVAQAATATINTSH